MPCASPLLNHAAAGQQGACKEAVLSVLDHMEQRAGPGRRVAYFYLLDAVLAVSWLLGGWAVRWQ